MKLHNLAAIAALAAAPVALQQCGGPGVPATDCSILEVHPAIPASCGIDKTGYAVVTLQNITHKKRLVKEITIAFAAPAATSVMSSKTYPVHIWVKPGQTIKVTP